MELTKRNSGTDWEGEAATAQSILFKMGSEYYGLSIALVREIIKPLPITRFPKSPVYVEGVIDLRGRILPIVNLRKMFGLEPLE
ncbi:chemotaxis protein CheW, partial [Mesorhizobium sp. M00.F.Ca.ET.186.01.1.1]